MEYLPWSAQVVDEALEDYRHGQMPLLDLELGGGCDLGCIYCDSPARDVKLETPIARIQDFIRDGGVRWVFICGLGEPLFNDNGKTLLDLLEWAAGTGVSFSMFTNGIGINERLIEFIKAGVLNIKFKLDTLDEGLAKKIYGRSHAPLALKSARVFMDLATLTDGRTNMAASIVPTRLNINELPGLIAECVNNGVYPLLGHLEDAGRASASYRELQVTSDELAHLRDVATSAIGSPYVLPACPAVIAGVHVNVSGNVTVDRRTGLSCSWFWLEDVDTVNLGHINDFESWVAMGDAIRGYRAGRLSWVRDTLRSPKLPLGGCGGDSRLLLERYLAVVDRDDAGIGRAAN